MEARTSLLLRPVDIASLAYLRIATGILAFADVLGTFTYYHLQAGAFDPTVFQFRYYGFEWVTSWAEPWMSLFFVVLIFLSLAFIVGWRFRVTAPLLFLGYTYTFLLEKAHYLNHAYLFCWLLGFLALSSAWREWSVDVWRRPQAHRTQVLAWQLWLPRGLMAIVYFFGGLAKINPDWLRAMPLQLWLKNKADIPVVGPLLQHPEAAYFMAYGGLFLDLLIVPMLLWRRTRWLAVGMAVFFHATNLVIFNIGIFPFLSLVLTSLFFAPDWPRRFVAWVAERWRGFGRAWQRWLERMDRVSAARLAAPSGWRRSLLLAGFSAFILFHAWLPLRHNFMGRDVVWDEFGHRYSWRMMLRTKAGVGAYYVVDKATQDTTEISPRRYLKPKQARKLVTHPDMILQYAHFLRDKAAASDMDVAVYADMKVRVNDGRYQRYVDPTVDLAQEHWSFYRLPHWLLSQEEAAAFAE